jgi:hypothetical protein
MYAGTKLTDTANSIERLQLVYAVLAGIHLVAVGLQIALLLNAPKDHR